MLARPLTPPGGEKPQKMKKQSKLNVEEAMAEFLKSEESSPHRKGTFKIDAPFEDALKIIVKATPDSKKTNPRKG
jgi:hypothetical protein